MRDRRATPALDSARPERDTTPVRDGEKTRRRGGPGELRAAIHAVVRRIPRGKVATYGQVAALAGFARHARQVGHALGELPAGSALPWHRVVNARGEVSPRGAAAWEEVQKDLLEQEGIELGPHDRVDLARHGWKPRTRRRGG